MPDARLSSRIALIGRPAEPTERLGNVLRNAVTIVKHASEHKLRPRIALLGQRPPQAHRSRIVAPLMRSSSILERPGARRASRGKREQHRAQKPS